MLKKLALGIAVVLAILVGIVATRPAEFRIERRIEIAAAPPGIYAMLIDFHAWDQWSPWAKLDPGMKKTWSGAERGKGAAYDWSGDNRVGAGRMEIIDVRDNQTVTIQLDFLAPMKATNTAEFTLKPAGDKTTVTWTMSGSNSFVGKAMGLILNMDQLVGADFEKGLANLKNLVERGNPPAA